MFDIVLDTNVLSDFIACYYKYDIRKDGDFIEYENLSGNLVFRLNEILNNYRSYDTLNKGVIIASTLAFVEIARQFDKISKGRFTRVQFKAFIDSPPQWFIIETMNNELFPFLQELPSSVKMPNGAKVPIEWADAIHVATALARSENCNIVATDGRIIRILSIQDRILS